LCLWLPDIFEPVEEWGNGYVDSVENIVAVDNDWEGGW
jgi:hypothetical protein